MTIASAAHLAGRAFHILFGERNKQHKNNLLIILATSFLITFCLPVLAISVGLQMIEDRVTGFFNLLQDVFDDLFGGVYNTSEADLQRWMEEDLPNLSDLTKEDYPSLKLAYAISYYYQAIGKESIFSLPGDFISIFENRKTDECLEIIQQQYGLEFSPDQEKALAALGEQLMINTNPELVLYGVSGGQLLDVPENTYYPGSDPRCATIWNEAYSIGGGNPYYYFAITGDWSPRQCTTYAWYRFYQYYGYSPGATGDGRSFAAEVVRAHSDRFVLRYAPAAGSIMSFPPTGENIHGHVGFVEKVEGDYMWYSEGNYCGGGIRMNTKVSISSLTRARCGNSACIAYAVPTG